MILPRLTSSFFLRSTNSLSANSRTCIFYSPIKLSDKNWLRFCKLSVQFFAVAINESGRRLLDFLVKVTLNLSIHFLPLTFCLFRFLSYDKLFSCSCNIPRGVLGRKIPRKCFLLLEYLRIGVKVTSIHKVLLLKEI